MDNSILSKARENYDKFNQDNNLDESDEAENPYYWSLKARGEEWFVEPANWNSAAADYYPDSMQPSELKQVKLTIDKNLSNPTEVDMNGTVYMATEDENFKTATRQT